MLSMTESVFTRQANMNVEVTVTTNTQGEDVMRFKLAEPIDISLTGTEGTGQLKTLFATLLGILMEEDVEVAFSKTDGYSTKMYEDVCVEYVKVLNDELATARENAKKEGLAK